MKTKFALAFLLLVSAVAWSQGSQLTPPAGSKVAIVVFEDLQCPSCSSAEPVLKDVEKTEHVPLVRHDFPIPQHSWSGEAHIMARWFDSQSPAMGEEFRHWIFENQRSITKANLREKANQFAEAHKVGLPAFIDPSGKFKTQVDQDFNLGQRLGVSQTPTIYVVGMVNGAPQSVQVNDVTQLAATVQQMKQQAGPDTPAKATKPAAKKAPKRGGKGGK